MKVTYKFVDKEGNEFRSQLPPWVDHPVTIVAASYWPNNDPEDPSADEMIVTFRVDDLES